MPEYQEVMQHGVSDKDLESADLSFIKQFNRQMDKACLLATKNGFWDDDGEPVAPTDPIHIGNKLMLIVGEVSEAHEILRKSRDYLGVTCDKDVDLGAFEEELADAVIRIMDLAAYCGINLGRAIALKHKYNAERPFKHGKQF